MDREKLYNSLFKTNIKGEKKFNNFSQLTPSGKRIFVLMLNLALGNEPKIVFEWLVAKNVLSGSNSEKRTVQHIIHHWKISGGEIFQNYSKSSSETNPLTCDQNSQH